MSLALRTATGKSSASDMRVDLNPCDERNLIMKNQKVRNWPIGIAIAFGCGVLLGTQFPNVQVRAQRSENIQSVQSAFLEGGDRRYSVLKEIHAELRRNHDVLVEMNATEKRIEENLRKGIKIIE